MLKYKMTIAYDGTNYGGWQIQPNAPSIQDLIEKKLSIALREKVAITGSGRTDSGVHALGQVAHFSTEKEVNPYKLHHSLNSLLPFDVRIKEITKAQKDFHARYSATGKVYYYHLHLDKVGNPFTRLYAWHVLHKVDLLLLRASAPLFLGTKDFSAFACEAHKGAAAKNGVRTLKRLDVIEEEGGVRLELEADGFLYKMARSITGTLMDICAGHITPEEIPSIFAAKDRRRAGRAAPPHGLFLAKVFYKEAISSNEE
jgi:tRNA pseudouridine38-40 synthase